MEILIICIIIIAVRIVDVSLGTVRMVLIVRGNRRIGAMIGFIEVLIWFLVVRRALMVEEQSLWVAMSYAGGFSLGTFLGVKLEEILAIGNASIQVITKGIREDLVDVLRKNGFAVSTVVTKGIKNENLMLLIEVNRKRIKEAVQIVNEVTPDSFVTISDVKHIIGGYFPGHVRR